MKHYQSDDDSEEARLAGFESFARDYVKKSFEKHTKLGAQAWEHWIQNVHEEQVRDFTILLKCSFFTNSSISFKIC